ncbi:complex I intermediate-associated protein 30 [Phyllosticta citribraziliensis]|uniref:Complex I intermediate-associated protein 30 n=1 Tax=Phyllosticta citribraziliensis TaxID=989973 RepID=A0ABR1LQ14_9PEZI
MRVTSPLARPPGFFKRSWEELKRRATIASKFEGLYEPTKPYNLVTFSNPDAVEPCKRMSDKDTGGFSEVKFDHVPASKGVPSHARFHGTISTELPKDSMKIMRTGYAGWRTRDQGPTLFGRSVWDIDPYRYLALRIKSDGRKYFVNLQTDSIVPTDLHQHRLYARTPGKWETVLINFDEFVRTNHGMRVQPEGEMLRQKVRTVGISLTDRLPGPFELCISQIYATNNEPEEREAGRGRRVDTTEKRGED